MASFVIGDYKYTILNDNNVRVEVVDTTKSSYSDIPASVTYNNITYNVTDMYTTFFGCRSLTTAPTIPSSVTNIDYTFSECTSLTTAPTIPSSVTNMSSTFRRCTSLTTAPTIPSSVTSTDRTFYGCTNLTGTIYVENIPNLYEDMFTGTTRSISLKKGSRIPDNVTHEEFDNFWLNSSVAMSYNNVDYAYDWFSPEGSDYDYTIELNVNPSFVKAKVKDKTKTSYANLVSPVSYRGSSNYILHSIEHCFEDCTNMMTSPTLPSSTSEFYNMKYAFKGCTSLTTAPTIPSSVTDMDGAFVDCTSLTTIPTDLIPLSVTNMYAIFYGCTNLTNTPTIPSNVNTLLMTFRNCTSLTNVPVDLIPSSVRNMGYMFDGCTNLTNVPTIPSGVIDMSYAFNGCTNLINNSIISIPSSVRNTKWSFSECTSLRGNIVVHNTPTNFALMFRKTNNDIYIVNRSGSSSPWTTIADTYSNVHYGANDNPVPTITRSRILRTADSSSTDSSISGTWIYLYLEGAISNQYIPDGWTIDTSTPYTIKIDNSASITLVNASFTRDTSTGQFVLYGWYNTQDFNKHILDAKIVSKIYDDSLLENIKSSQLYSYIFQRAFALVDYYHNPAWVVYFKTSDTSVDTSKTYYSYDAQDDTYEIVTPVGTENPLSEGWFEQTTEEAEGIAFGQPCIEPNFTCNMDAKFNQEISSYGNITRDEHVITKGYLQANFWDVVYPVGTIYETRKTPSEFDPNVTWGGTWTRISDKFLLASGSTYSVGDPDGGESTHLLTAEESGQKAGSTENANATHSHNPSTTTEYFVTCATAEANNTRVAYSGSGNRLVDGMTNTSSSVFHHRKATDSQNASHAHSISGSSATKAHNNMPPYTIITVWERIA